MINCGSLLGWLGGARKQRRGQGDGSERAPGTHGVFREKLILNEIGFSLSLAAKLFLNGTVRLNHIHLGVIKFIALFWNELSDRLVIDCKEDWMPSKVTHKLPLCSVPPLTSLQMWDDHRGPLRKDAQTLQQFLGGQVFPSLIIISPFFTSL